MKLCSLCNGHPSFARGYCRKCYLYLYRKKGHEWNDRRTKEFRHEADAPKCCAVQGCVRKPFFRGCCQHCYKTLRWRIGPKWHEEVPKLVLKPEGSNCCFKTCWETATEFDLEEFPACKKHRECMHWMLLLDEAGYERSLLLPDDPDWLSARWIAEIRDSAKPKERHLFDRVCGETPLFPIFFGLFGRYLPVLKSL